MRIVAGSLNPLPAMRPASGLARITRRSSPIQGSASRSKSYCIPSVQYASATNPSGVKPTTGTWRRPTGRQRMLVRTSRSSFQSVATSPARTFQGQSSHSIRTPAACPAHELLSRIVPIHPRQSDHQSPSHRTGDCLLSISFATHASSSANLSSSAALTRLVVGRLYQTNQHRPRASRRAAPR